MIDLSTIDARKSIVSKWANKYGLDIAMVCAVCEQESTWYPYAVRYEPAFYERYIVPMKLTDITSAQMRSTSWGLMQMMGQTALEFGFTGRSFAELCDPDTGIDFGCRKLQKCFATHGADESGLMAYNGGGNAQYGQQVLARVANYN